MSLIKLTGASKFVRPAITDPDAINYISGVEAADGQELEYEVKEALQAFIVGCKDDGIWSAIKSSCIFAGARTFDGARVPLVGASLDYVEPAPYDSTGFALNYNRKTGLGGSGWGYSYPGEVYLQAPTLNVVSTNSHVATYITEPDTNTHAHDLLIGAGWWFTVGAGIRSYEFTPGNGIEYVVNLHGSYVSTGIPRTGTTGFLGVSRNSSSSINFKSSASSVINYASSATNPTTFKAPIKSMEGSNTIGPSNARMFFYSIGEHIDLAKLDSRIASLSFRFNLLFS